MLTQDNTLQDGRYIIIRKLGEGGMGTTYLARHVRLGRECVIKVIRQDVSDEARRQQFEREAQLLANVRHPNLPAVHDYFAWQDLPVIVMQYVAGKTLQELCDEATKPFDVPRVLEWAEDLLLVLRYLHSQEPPIIHRDVTPRNVCMTKQGETFLLDFGIARHLDGSRTSTGAQALSDIFAPIEQYYGDNRLKFMSEARQYVERLRTEGIQTGPYTDIYSLGVTLYLALTLSLPRDAVLRVLEEAHPPIQELNPDVPPLLVEAINKAMAIDPKDRFQSAAEMQTFLQPLFEGTISAGESRPLRHRPAIFMAQALPIDFVARPFETRALVAHLLDSEQHETGDITAALRGAGGYGKTTLARAICHDERLWQAFPDGILWVTLGERPNVVGGLTKVYTALTGQRPAFIDLEDGTTQLAQAWADKRCLLVVDDVWNQAHLRPFLRGGSRCVRLITTRNSDTLPLDAKQVNVLAMQKSEAVALLSTDLPVTPTDANPLDQLAASLGEWPLLLKLTNSTLRERLYFGLTLAEAINEVNEELIDYGLTAFDADNAIERDQAIEATIQASLSRLTYNERQRYAELALFPEDIDIPLPTLEKLWQATAHLKRSQVRRLYRKLFRLSLLLNANANTIRLHDVIRAYLAHQQKEQLPTLHTQLLNAHRPQAARADGFLKPVSSPTWADMPLDEPYLWDELCYHLTEAGRGDELVQTVKDLRYLAVKTFARGTAEADLLAAETHAPDDETLRLLRRSFVNASHLLNQCDQLNDLAITLHSRLQHFDALTPLTRQLAESLALPYLTARYPLPDLPHPALIRTLTGHTDKVNDCAVSANGRLIVSASDDKTLKVWDSQSGQLIRTLTGHTDRVLGCTISADGCLIVSASCDGTLKVWKTQSGELIHTLVGHTDKVNDCAINADGRLIISASDDRTVKIWDGQNGQVLYTLSKHNGRVLGCAVSANGDLIVSVSRDGTLNVWDSESGQLRLTLTENQIRFQGGDAISADGSFLATWLESCAVSADGSLIVSASGSMIVNGDHNYAKVWNSQSGQTLFTLTGYTHSVHGCAVSANGNLIVTASEDWALRVWDGQRGQAQLTCIGHTAGVNGCAVSANGRLIVSASSDKSLKVWDGQSKQADLTLTGYIDYVSSCAVSADGHLIVSNYGDGQFAVWDSQSGQQRSTFTSYGLATSCAVSADGSIAVFAAGDMFEEDRVLMVSDIQSQQARLIFTGHTTEVKGCAINADGRLIVSASLDQPLKVWDSQNGQLIHTLTGHTGTVFDCAISADGALIVSASSDKTLKVWDGRSGEQRFTLRGHTARVEGCAINADGSLIVSASHDRTLRVWNGQSGQERFTLRGHKDDVNACAISADGQIIVSASADRTLSIWDANSGMCLATLPVDGPLYDCACSADGQYIVAAGARGLYFLRLVIR